MGKTFRFLAVLLLLSLLFTGVCTVLMAVLVVWMHRANIQRLLNGTEYRFGEKKKDE